MSDPKTAVPSLYLRDEELRRGIDLLFFASRNLAGAGDDVLARHGLGRAHHRALHFIHRRPRITVGDLAELLGVSKQSLHRVLALLMAADLVVQHPGSRDRRQRRLSLTAKGAAVAGTLDAAQIAAIAAAYRAAGPQAVAGFWDVLSQIAGDAAMTAED